MDGNADHHFSLEIVHNLAQDLRSTCNHDGGVVLDVNRGQIYRLNSAGAMIFEGVKGGRRPAEIVEALANYFGIKRDMAEADVRGFLARLRNDGLIER